MGVLLTTTEIVGKQIKLRRAVWDMSAQALARKIGRSLITVYNYEQGKYAPNIEVLSSIANALHCSVLDLTGTKVSIELGEVT